MFTVALDNNTTIVFDKDGNWKEVDCKEGEIPTRMIPPKIIMALKNEGVSNIKAKKMWKDKDDACHIILDDDSRFSFDTYFKIMK